MINIKTKEEIKIMREAGRILAAIMKQLQKEVKPGIATNYLDKVAEDLVFRSGAKPSFKGYLNFPAALCVSINEEIVHCIPSKRELKEGDIVSLDLGLIYKNFHSDMAITVPVGKVSPKAQRLIKITRKALNYGISKIKPGMCFGDIGNAIQKYAEQRGCDVIKELCGHGIGRNLHEEPQIPNFGRKGSGPEIKEGMVFCLEPMVSIGDWQIKKAKDNYGWQTKDNSLCVHFEHTIAVIKNGSQILTGD